MPSDVTWVVVPLIIGLAALIACFWAAFRKKPARKRKFITVEDAMPCRGKKKPKGKKPK